MPTGIMLHPHPQAANVVDDVVSQGLEQLPPRQRVVVAMRDLEGRTADEVSDLLMISAGNQRVLLHRGRAKLRAVWEEASS